MSGRQGIGIVGGGRAGTALALALVRAGWPPAGVSSRDPARRAALGDRLAGVTVMAQPREVALASHLVILAVPDDAIRDVAAGLGARPGSVVAHLSGVHPASVLRDGVAPGVAVGAFHPLVAFADAERGADALRGAYVALDGDPEAIEALRAMGEAVGARPVVLAGGDDQASAKAAHHAAAVLAAGGFVALLDAIVELGRAAGLDEATSVEVYGSLVRQGLANAAALGVDAALTGPVPRGDVGTVAAHLEAIAASAPDVWQTYVALGRRQLAIARRHDAPADEATAALDVLLGASDVPRTR